MKSILALEITGPQAREACLQTSALPHSNWVTGQVFLPWWHLSLFSGLPENIPSLHSHNSLAFLLIAGGQLALSKTYSQRSFSVAFCISFVLIYWIWGFRLWLFSDPFPHSDTPFYFWLWHQKCEHLWKFRNMSTFLMLILTFSVLCVVLP